MAAQYANDVTRDDVIIWMITAVAALFINITLVCSHNQQKVDPNCTSNHERVQAGVLIDTSGGRYSTYCKHFNS